MTKSKLKTEREIMDKIVQVTKTNLHVLDQPLRDTETNVVVALMQLSAISELDALWWCVGMPRPRYKYDKRKK